MVLLGVVVAAHGVRGLVKVKAFTQSPGNIFAYGSLWDEKGYSYSLKLVRESPPDHLIVAVEGVDNRNQAESLRGTKLYVERRQLPDLVEEEFYHSDLIGLAAQDLEGRVIGQVRAVHNFGAGDFLEIMAADGQLYTISFTQEAVPFVRLPEEGEGGCIQINRQFLLGAE